MRALLLVLVVACSSQTDKASPTPTATPTPTASPTENPSPTGDPSPAPTPAQTPTPPGGADCKADADCATTTYAAEPVKGKGGCCAALVCPRIETAKRAQELADAWSSACGAVRCRAADCPAGAEPVPTCQSGRCAAR